MEETTRHTITEFHRKMAAELFNKVWSLIEKPDRTVEEDDTMVHVAHASRYHWEQVQAPATLARGEWQIARVYTLLNRPESAQYHARRCLERCEAEGLGDWDIAFAQEAVARAAACAGNKAGFAHHFQLANELGNQIVEEEERTHFFQDLAGGPWFGMH